LTTDVSKTLWLLEDRVCGCQRAVGSCPSDGCPTPSSLGTWWR